MEMVDIGCDTELRLRLGGESSGKGEREQQQKQLTLFYNDQMRVCDVTETQARAIISMAKLEMEDRVKNQYKQQQQQWKSSSSSQDLAIPPRMLNRQLSMKRSLQQFLQERKTRRTSISPDSRRA